MHTTTLLRLTMKLDQFYSIAGQSYPIYPQLIKRLGISVNAGLLLSYIGWRTPADSPGAWVELSLEQVTNDTGLTPWEQRGARKQLVACGAIHEQHNPLTHQSFYCVTGEVPEVAEVTNADIGENQRRALPKPTPGFAKTNSSNKGKEICKEKEKSSADAVPSLEPPAKAEPPNGKASKKAPNPRHCPFIKDWEARYEAHFGFAYSMQNGRDARAVATLVSRPETNDELLAIAEEGWRASGPGVFWGPKATTIHFFAEHLNEIRAELRKTPSRLSPAGLAAAHGGAADNDIF